MKRDVRVLEQLLDKGRYDYNLISIKFCADANNYIWLIQKYYNYVFRKTNNLFYFICSLLEIGKHRFLLLVNVKHT